VNRKLKFSVPSAGLVMPSIFCSTQGPTIAFVVTGAEAACCHGQLNLTSGSRTLIPARCSAADSAVIASHATARRKTTPAAMTTAQRAHRGTRAARRTARRARPGPRRRGLPGGFPGGFPGRATPGTGPGSGSGAVPPASRYGACWFMTRAMAGYLLSGQTVAGYFRLSTTGTAPNGGRNRAPGLSGASGSAIRGQCIFA
jgi:hypothetical protein